MSGLFNLLKSNICSVAHSDINERGLDDDDERRKYNVRKADDCNEILFNLIKNLTGNDCIFFYGCIVFCGVCVLYFF